MKFSTLLLSASLAVSSVFAVPYNRAHLEEAQNEKRQSGYTAVTGPSGPVQPRLEIRQMYWNRPNQFTLLLLALQQYQSMSQNDKLSYYQIAGIHGVPRVDWDGVGKCNGCSADGYCPHDSILFPAWHRVYVALFEQQFLSIVNDIANKWTGPGTSVIQQAAREMRWPYWDWAAKPGNGLPAFPGVMTQKFVSVTSATSTQTIINPLFRYSFQDNSGLAYYPFSSNWRYTYRYPNTDDGTAVSDQNTVVNAFANIQSSLQDQVWQLFSTCKDYTHFSNDDAGSSSTSCSNSLEGIHNTVHMTTGGTGSDSVAPGHMSILSVASFDPVFWLHHANVDRIFAMWQTINSGSYGGGQNAPHDTWVIKQGTYMDENSPLKPMHKDTAGNFWTTNEVRDWKVFGYTYPEFSNSDGSAGAITNYAQNLYGPGATATAGSSKRDLASTFENVGSGLGLNYNPTSSVADSIPVPTSNPLNQLVGTIKNVTSTLSTLANPIQANNGSLFQYVANVNAPRYALNGSYNIYLFNGKPTTEDPSKWITDASLIGPIGVLAQPGMTGHSTTIAASVPLTRTLTYALSANLLNDLSEELVVPYLNANLYWRVAGPDGKEVKSDTIEGFSVKVYGSTASQAPAGELPCYSDFIPLDQAVKDCAANNLLQ